MTDQEDKAAPRAPDDRRGFEQLVGLLDHTHRALQEQAARSVDTALVVRNWLFGWYVVEFEHGAAERVELYGKQLISRLSVALGGRGVRGVSPTNLRKFREFYLAYADIQQTLSVESLVPTGRAGSPPTLATDPAVRTGPVPGYSLLASTLELVQPLAERLGSVFRLGWSHYVSLLTVDDPDERRFYEIEAGASHWSVRELRRQIGTSLYQRLALSRDQEEIRRLSRQGQVVEKPSDLVKSPYVLEFLDLPEQSAYSERDLETAIIDKLEHFLLELGKGFLFEARQRRFTFDDDHFYVDLVFYNRLLRCYVLIDLKRDKLTHQDLGQMQMYVNYFDRHVKLADEAPTVGIVLCHRRNEALVELTLPQGTNIYASKYQLYLPSKEELLRQLELAKRELEDRASCDDR